MVEKGEQFVIGRYLRDVREKNGYIREQVAERANIGVRYLTAIENEEKKTRVDVLFRIIRALGMSANDLVYQERHEDLSEADRLVNLLYTCTPMERKLVGALIDTLLYNRDKLDHD